MISLLVAHDNDRVIGKSNKLPWHIPADLKRFKSLTLGHSVIMGRKTYQSILDQLGRSLPNRRNIVISRTMSESPGITVVPSLEEAVRLCEGEEETFIIGGGQVFSEALEKNLADRIYVTLIKASTGGDVYFPDYNPDDWKIIAKEPGENDSRYPYEFITYQKEGDL